MNSTLTDADANSTPTTEAELRAAIASLKASTQTTEHRTKILNSQSALADRLRNSQGQIRARRIGHASHFKQRESAEVQHVKFAVGIPLTINAHASTPPADFHLTE